MSIDSEYWRFMLLKMGGENTSPFKYKVYDRVEIAFGVNSADCIFTPPRGKQWKTEAKYNEDNFEVVVKSYFFVAWYLRELQDWKYQLPVFMQKHRTDSNLLHLKSSIDKYSENAVCKIEFSDFNKQWKFWSDKYENDH